MTPIRYSMERPVAQGNVGYLCDTNSLFNGTSSSSRECRILTVKPIRYSMERPVAQGNVGYLL